MSSPDTGQMLPPASSPPTAEADTHAAAARPQTPPGAGNTAEGIAPEKKQPTTPRLVKNSNKYQTYKHRDFNKQADVEMKPYFTEVSDEIFNKLLPQPPPEGDVPIETMAPIAKKLVEDLSKISTELKMYDPLVCHI